MIDQASPIPADTTADVPTALLLPVDSPRTIRLTIGKTPIDFTFAAIDDKTWRKFLEQIVTRVEMHNGERAEIEDSDAALCWLFNEVCVGAVGYKGTEDLQTKAIIARIPIRHRVAAAGILRSVGTSTAGEATLSELSEIQLEAPWSVGASGQMEMYQGLIHRFQQPTVEQYRRFKLGSSRILVSGDAKDGTTVYPSRLVVALGLYNELIAEVEGYSVDGQPLTDPKQIVKFMDGMHKARAVLELFERSEEEISLGSLLPESTPEAADAAAE